nr:protein-tyrosine phosphatase family protein [Actinomadura flavalba]
MERLSGAIELPEGAFVRGRGLRKPLPGGVEPEFGVYLGTPRFRRAHGAGIGWAATWVEWPDFLLPRDHVHAATVLRELHRRAGDGERVEVACGGGVGRTGTALACLAVLDGLSPADAITWVRAHHHPRAVETPWQRRWIARFPDLG